MAIDAYSPCPCDSSQKIKFCCGKDVVSDLSKIIEQSASGQTGAAFDRLNRTIVKLGPVDCLLVIKTRMLIEMERLDEAKQVNAELLQRSPKNPMGLQQQAALSFETGEFRNGINQIQDAIELHKGSDIPDSLAGAFRMASHASFYQGKTIAGFAHLSFAIALANDEARQSLREELRSFMDSTHWLVRQPLVPSQGPDDLEWSKLYANVHRAIARGQFRRALQFLDKIDQDHPDQPIVVEALAIVKSMLAMDDAAEAWKRYADHGETSRERRIEALAIANLLTSEPEETQPYISLTFAIKDFEQAAESLIASNWVSDDRKKMAVQEPGDVPPRYVFVLYSREFRVSETYDENFSPPTHVGVIRVFGRQTDREARIQINVVQNQMKEVTDRLIQVLGDSIDPTPEEENIGEMSVEHALLDRSIEIPSDINPSQLKQLRQNEIDARFVDQWASLPISSGNEQTIRDSIADPSMTDYAYARFVASVFSSGEVHDRNDFHRIRNKLQLPELDKVDATSPRALTSPFLLQWVDIEALETSKLEKIVVYLQSILATTAVRPFLDELLQREDRRSEMETEFKAMRARLADEPEEAIKLLDEALAAAESDSMQEGICRVDRLRAFLVFGEMERAQSELGALRPFLKVPYINFLVTTLLTEMGLLRPDIPLEQQIPESPEPAPELAQQATVQAAPESKLWLPE